METIDHDALIAMPLRLKLTAIRDQLAYCWMFSTRSR